jgi:hypothetical protein
MRRSTGTSPAIESDRPAQRPNAVHIGDLVKEAGHHPELSFGGVDAGMNLLLPSCPYGKAACRSKSRPPYIFMNIHRDVFLCPNVPVPRFFASFASSPQR